MFCVLTKPTISFYCFSCVHTHFDRRKRTSVVSVWCSANVHAVCAVCSETALNQPLLSLSYYQSIRPGQDNCTNTHTLTCF